MTAYSWQEKIARHVRYAYHYRQKALKYIYKHHKGQQYPLGQRPGVQNKKS